MWHVYFSHFSSFLFYIYVHHVGQWILQLSQVDSGKRPHRTGLAVLHWWGQLWTGNTIMCLNVCFCWSVSHFKWEDVIVKCFIFIDISGGFKAKRIRHGYNQWQQKRIHRVSCSLALFVNSCIWHFILTKSLFWLCTAWWFSGGLWTGSRNRWTPFWRYMIKSPTR